MPPRKNLPENSIEETMIMPFWGRAVYSKKFPSLLEDQKAIEIMSRMSYDFSEIQTYSNEYSGIVFLARARNFDEALIQYLQRYPEATVVNLGAGLDTTFYRVDNGKIMWYDLDLPEAISFRKQFLSEGKRNKYIAKSIFDYSWFNDIQFSPEKGIFFIAGGLFMYFKEAKIKQLLLEMANHFSRGELVFDIGSCIGRLISNLSIRRSGRKDYYWHFYVQRPKGRFEKWSDHIELVDSFTFWSKTPKNTDWHIKTRMIIFFSDLLKLGRIIHLRFKK